jgi:hypothetical protein
MECEMKQERHRSGMWEPGLLDKDAITVVKNMRQCSRACPAFILCPLMPLAVQPKEPGKRICLVNMGDDRLKVAYYKMFVGGTDGVVQMLQTNLLEYGELLKKSGNLPVKDRLRALEKFNSMLGQLHKMMGQSRNNSGSSKKQDDDEMDEVILIASGNDPKPDPESLEHSPLLEQLIQHEPILQQKKPEIDLGKELLDKFFPQEEL